LLITIVGLVVGRGMVDNWGIGWGMDSMMNNRGGNIGWGMVNNWGIGWGMDSMMNNRGSMNCMMESRGSMVDCMATKCCELSSWASCHKGNKSNQSKDLHDVST